MQTGRQHTVAVAMDPGQIRHLRLLLLYYFFRLNHEWIMNGFIFYIWNILNSKSIHRRSHRRILYTRLKNSKKSIWCTRVVHHKSTFAQSSRQFWSWCQRSAPYPPKCLWHPKHSLGNGKIVQLIPSEARLFASTRLKSTDFKAKEALSTYRYKNGKKETFWKHSPFEHE